MEIPWFEQRIITCKVIVLPLNYTPSPLIVNSFKNKKFITKIKKNYYLNIISEERLERSRLLTNKA